MFDLILSRVVLDGKCTDIGISDGRICSIGKLDGADSSETVECRGGFAVAPAFYNTHTHAAMTLLRGFAEDMELFEWLNEHIWPVEASLSGRDIYVGSRLAAVEMIRSGTVYFNDSYWQPKYALRAAEELGMRATVGLLSLSNADESGNIECMEEFKSCSCKDRINISHSPHAIYTVSEARLREIAGITAENRMPVHIHLAETLKEFEDCRKEHNGMTPTEYLDSLGLINERTMLAHCVYLTDHDREIIAEKGAFIAHNPVSNMKLCSGLFDFEKAQSAGCRITIGTDGTSSNNSLSMFDEMKCAALTAKVKSSSPRAGKVQDIFRAATVGGAAFAGVDGGVVAEGKAADLLLIDLSHPVLSAGYDLVSDLVYAATPEVIDSVLCAGKFLMRDKKIPGESEITGEAVEVCRRIKRDFKG